MQTTSSTFVRRPADFVRVIVRATCAVSVSLWSPFPAFDAASSGDFFQRLELVTTSLLQAHVLFLDRDGCNMQNRAASEPLSEPLSMLMQCHFGHLRTETDRPGVLALFLCNRTPCQDC